MNKLTTALLGLSLMVGSAFAAPKQADSTKMADQSAATSTPTTKKTVKKHVKHHARKTAATADTTAAPAAK